MTNDKQERDHEEKRPLENTVRLWTCIASCQVCGKELNRAIHVPDDKKFRVSITAAFNCICDEPGHSTFSDCNFAPKLEWQLEPNAALTGERKEVKK